MATLIPQTALRPNSFYASHTATSQFLARRKVIASLSFINLGIKLFLETGKLQNRNHTALQVHCKVTVRWSCDGREVTYGFYPVLGA